MASNESPWGVVEKKPFIICHIHRHYKQKKNVLNLNDIGRREQKTKWKINSPRAIGSLSFLFFLSIVKYQNVTESLMKSK